MRIFKIIKILFSKKKRTHRAMCANCRHFVQGDKYGYCGNQEQTNSELTKYTHPSLNCPLYENGTHKTRIEYMKSNNK